MFPQHDKRNSKFFYDQAITYMQINYDSSKSP